MPQPTDQRCGNCQFWILQTDKYGYEVAAGICRRYPRDLYGPSENYWCGEWKLAAE